MSAPAKQTRKARLLAALPWLVFFAVLGGLAVVRGLTKSYTIGYEIMNGDFQNYNPVRRLLAGQRPFEDFTVYLGAGELYSVAAVLLAVGNNFANSMFASNALTWFFFELLVFAAALAVLGGARRARGFTLAAVGLFFGVVQGLPLLGSLPGAAWLQGLLGYAAANGNSARMIRSAGLPLALLLAAWGLRAYTRRGGALAAGLAPAQKSCTKFSLKIWLKRCFPLPPWVLIPLLAGALVPWSNDMGAALYIALSLAYGLWLIRVYGRKIQSILLAVLRYVAISVAGLGASVLLVSLGHPFAWLRQTRGTGSFQAWYYGSAQGTKLYYLKDLALDGAFWLALALAAAFAVWLFAAKSDAAALSAAGGFTLCLGMALWNVLYCLLSSSPAGPAGGAQALLPALLLALAVRGALFLWKKRPKNLGSVGEPVTAVLAAAVLCIGLYGQISARTGENGGRAAEYAYQPALGGWLGTQTEKLATEQSIAGGKTVWSTYASALEAMTGRFQPSGTDYIIHVLGDRQRLDYLQTFQAGGFDLVETPSFKVSSFERWSRNANWWFYRELYRYWAPVGTTFACGGMHIFWQQTGADGALEISASAALTQESDAAVLLTVKTEDPAFCGVADVNVQYTRTVRPGFALKGGLGSFVQVEALTEKQLCEAAGRESENCDFFIPTDRPAYDIPVTISNGAGTVRLNALPADAASLTVQGADITALYTDWEYFYE